jgi:hypothetical protein
MRPSARWTSYRPFFVSFPDLDARARDGPAVGIADASDHPARLAGCPEGHVAARFDERSAGHEERAEDRRFGGVAVGLVVDADHLHGEAEHVGQQNELLPPVGGDVPALRKEPHRRVPFLFRQSGLAHESVEVPDQRLHELLEPLVVGPVEGVLDPLYQFGFGHARRIPGVHSRWRVVDGAGWDPADPTSGDGWENQALFDYDNRALPALNLFRRF